MDGLPDLLARIHLRQNQYLATREILHFEETFSGAGRPIWNTQTLALRSVITGPTRSWALQQGAMAPAVCRYLLPISGVVCYREDCQFEIGQLV